MSSDGELHARYVAVCPHCSSARVRRRSRFHMVARWRCRNCRKTFFMPRTTKTVEPAPEQTWSDPGSGEGRPGPALPRKAVAVLVRDRKVLLVRDKGWSAFSLPSVTLRRGEPSVAVVARKLFEETGLEVTKVEYICAFAGEGHDYRVFRTEAEGAVRPARPVEHLTWWDGADAEHVSPSTTAILERLGFPSSEEARR